MKLDLHSHSTYSDGTLEPEDLVEAAARVGITHLALCDHDSTGGLERARQTAAARQLNIIPAIEINTQETEISVHVLGYFIEENDPGLQKILTHHRELRTERARLILEKLSHMGIKISLSDFNGGHETAAIGRPHIADKLKEKGIVFSRKEAFDKYLSKGKPGYVFYQGPTPKEAIEMILACKGVPVLAHPGFSISENTILSLRGLGLQGIEVFYPSHSNNQVHNFLAIAKRNDLVVTGGSDYHGPGSGHESLGEMDVPDATLDDLLNRKKKLFG